MGRLGEAVACRYLKRKGFDVVERNYRKKWGEIDIVAQKGKSFHFVEVKSVSCKNSDDFSQRTSNGTYRPEENVHFRKLQRLFRTIETYLAERSVTSDTNWQLDVLVVFLDMEHKKARMRVIDNVIL